MNVTELTLKLCQIPSTTGDEQAVTAYTAQLLKQEGYEVALQEVEFQRHTYLPHAPMSPQKSY